MSSYWVVVSQEDNCSTSRGVFSTNENAIKKVLQMIKTKFDQFDEDQLSDLPKIWLDRNGLPTLESIETKIRQLLDEWGNAEFDSVAYRIREQFLDDFGEEKDMPYLEFVANKLKTYDSIGDHATQLKPELILKAFMEWCKCDDNKNKTTIDVNASKNCTNYQVFMQNALKQVRKIMPTLSNHEHMRMAAKHWCLLKILIAN